MKKNKKFSFTLSILIINLIFYLIFLVAFYLNRNFIDYIALKPANIVKGKYLWTIVTSMFAHSPASVFHIFANMISLIFIGSFLERIIGRKRFIFIYLISGIIANLFFILFSLIFKNEFNAYALGASGAIFGLIGVVILLTPKLKVFVFPIPFPLPIWIASLIALFGLWIISIIAGLPIGNTAHLGGFITGIFYGLYLRMKYKRKVALLNKYLGVK
ncbi:MAG: rhomboid family intramembrane serine protease [Candidatus Pacearchaeota archaeon]